MSDITNQEEDWLLDDDAPSEPAAAVNDGRHPWKILIVDDEKDVHTATRIALRNIRYKERPLELLSAYSGKEAYEVMRQHPDIALIMLDVVMESEDAGLKLVHQIRQELKNGLVRIVLRTGQPGQAPEQEVILNYDINDYKTKTELTVQKLFTTIISSLRAYENLLSLEKNRQGLSKILESASDLYQLYSLREFASGVLRQISALLDIGTDGILCVRNDNSSGRPELEILAASGNYEPLGQSGDLSAFRNWSKSSCAPSPRSAASINILTTCSTFPRAMAANSSSTSRRSGRWKKWSATCSMYSASAFPPPTTISIYTASCAARKRPRWWRWPTWRNSATPTPATMCCACSG